MLLAFSGTICLLTHACMSHKHHMPISPGLSSCIFLTIFHVGLISSVQGQVQSLTSLSPIPSASLGDSAPDIHAWVCMMVECLMR